MSFATLPTNGRVLIQTTLGDIEVELWSRVGKHASPNENATEIGHRNVRKRVEILLPWPWKVGFLPGIKSTRLLPVTRRLLRRSDLS